MTLKKKIFPVLGAIILLGSLGYFIMQRLSNLTPTYPNKSCLKNKGKLMR